MILTLMQNRRPKSRTLASALACLGVLGVGGTLIGTPPVWAMRRDTKDGTEYTIKRVYKAGDTDRYQVTTKVTLDSPEGAQNAVLTMRLKDSASVGKEEGTYVLTSEFESAMVTSDGINSDLTKFMPKVITTHDKNGKSNVHLDGGADKVIAQLGDQIKQFTMSAASVYLPAKPVKVGESWDMSDEITAQKDPDEPKTKGDDKPLKIKGKVTLQSVDTVDGVKVGKFKTISNINLNKEIKLHTEATTLLDMTTGKPLSFTSNSEGTTAAGKVSTEMVLKVLGPNDIGDAPAPAKADSDIKKP